jgi:SAM-dependent methyltransferase
MTASATCVDGNLDQFEHWNAAAGESWAALSDRLDRMVGPIGDAAMDTLALVGGEHVVDIGCGCGQTTLELARRIGEWGDVVGVDVSGPMLNVANARAERAGLANVRFLHSDAQTHPFEASAANAVFSRFGVMFFSEPVEAFANIRKALSSNGRLAFVCWRAMRENPVMIVPMQAALPYQSEAPAADLFAPGPFAFAERDHLFNLLSKAGFNRIEITPHDQPLTTGDVEETIEIAMRIGPLGRALRERPELQARATEAVREAVIPYRTDHGVVFDSATWIVTARNEVQS